MFRMMTLDAAYADTLLENSGTMTALPDRSPIDLLCCQSITYNRTGRAPVTDLLADRLGLTCSCFAASRHHAEEGNTARGLALLTAGGIWVLNSGSFTIGAHDHEATVLFALVRKHSASVLVLNLHLATTALIRKKQLASLFTHPLLREQYGAVVLCADRAAALYAKEWQALTALSRYSLCHVQEEASRGMFCLLKARLAPMATVSVAAIWPPDLPGTTLEFEVERLSPEKVTRPAFPLSFREQWLGYREHRAFA